jgi:hypothetical protein
MPRAPPIAASASGTTLVPAWLLSNLQDLINFHHLREFALASFLAERSDALEVARWRFTMFGPALRRYRAIVLCLVVLLFASAARAEITIVLQNGFIEHYKRKVTIDTQFLVDKAHKKPNPPSKDGDLHIAGRADEVKLPIVAEIMNAKADLGSVKLIHDREGTGMAVRLTGAWRFWCEHGGSSVQVQGKPLKPFTTTNPDHVFEIHPVTILEERDLLPTLRPIDGFKTKDAYDAFTKYEGVRCKIIPGDETTTLVTTMAGYNYVEFMMEINSEPLEVEDGVLIMAKVRDLEGELLVRNRRMALVKDSEVEKQVRGKPIGTRVHVLGLPRINLSLVSWRTKAAAEGRDEVLTWSLPYEIIVVGFYNFVKGDGEDDIETKLKPSPKKGFVPKTFNAKELNKLLLPTLPDIDVELGHPSKGLKTPKAKGPPNTPPGARLLPLTPRTVLTKSTIKTWDLIEEK